MTISIILYRESAIMLSVVMLSVIMLSVAMLCVVKQSVVMLNVVVPLYDVAFASDLKNGTNPAI